MVHHERDVTDVPDERVASLLDAAAAPSEPGPKPGEAEALAVFRASRASTRRFPMRPSRTPTRIALAAAVGTGLLLTGGVGAAMAGALPGAAQDTAHEVLAALGVEVPGADDRSDGHPDERGRSGDRGPADEAETQEVETVTDPVEDVDPGADGAEAEDKGKGEEVSTLARETEAEGVDKGAEISGLASDGRSQAGQHGGAGTPGSPAQGKPEGAGDQANDTPKGGNATADEASGGTSSSASGAGQDKAEEASSGRSGGGTGKRP